MVKLGVNIDHIATLRQARKINMPGLVEAALICESAGADGITVHLREDRRHIQDSDVYSLKKTIKTKLNLEMSLNEDIIAVALDVKPDEVCMVPEKRQELTTEGGLDVKKDFERIKSAVHRLKSEGIRVSLFIDPDHQQVNLAKEAGSDCIELHTGRYSSVKTEKESRIELERLYSAGALASKIGLVLNAGHGLDYGNVMPVAKIPRMDTLNIGFSVVARAVFIGLYNAVREMKQLIPG